MEIKTVNTILYCKKWDETIDFYKNKLRFEVTASLDWFVEFKLNECARLSIANEKRATVKSSGGKGLTITMRVESIYKTFSFLKEAGVNPTAIKDHAWGAKVVHVFDPEGNRIEFWFQG
jgi:uncharacterized glyoxalase superfamily protein PhnB